MTLTEFLLARIAEDEAHAAALSDDRPSAQMMAMSHLGDQSAIVMPRSPRSAFNPTRVLVECEAKRWIVEDHQCETNRHKATDDRGRLTGEWVETAWCTRCGDHSDPYEVVLLDWPCPTIRALAVPYADHPDYREEWRP